MPGINGRALDVMKDIALDVLSLQVDEEFTFNFKDGPVTIKRTR